MAIIRKEIFFLIAYNKRLSSNKHTITFVNVSFFINKDTISVFDKNNNTVKYNENIKGG